MCNPYSIATNQITIIALFGVVNSIAVRPGRLR
jgi:hypothetical protein